MNLFRTGRFSIVLCATLRTASNPAHGDEVGPVERGMEEIKRLHADCRLSIQNYATLRDEAVADEPALPGDYQFWIYGLDESCGESRKPESRIAVFRITDDDNLVRVNTDRLVWRRVKGADFNDRRAVLYTVTWGPNDPPCCPTAGRSIAVPIRGGSIQTKDLRSWTERMP